MTRALTRLTMQARRTTPVSQGEHPLERPYLIYGLLAAGACVLLFSVVFLARRLRGGTPPGLSTARPPQEALSKIERIKRYREQHRVGLKEAKDAIEAQERGLAGPAAAPLGTPALSVKALVDAGQLIEAIKLYRAQTGSGLKEAKDAIDRMRGSGPDSPR